MYSSAHPALDTTSAPPPVSAPPSTAPAKPPSIPSVPSATPTARTIVALATTITHRAGRAASMTERVPCWASEVNMRIPVTDANIATSGSG